MSVGRKINIPLPPNGHQLAEIVAHEVELSLKQFFKLVLAYPNATVKFQWSANFFSSPFNYEDSKLLAISSEGETVTSLLEKGLEPEMSMDSIEIGVPTPSSPALVRPGIASSSSSLPPPATESAGRRDINARRGRGIDRVAGQFMEPSLANVGDQSKVVSAMRTEVADLEKGEDQPLHESTIIIPEKGKGEGGENGNPTS